MRAGRRSRTAPTDARLAWRGTLAERPEDELRVEAAFLLKRPVYFEVLTAAAPTGGRSSLLGAGQTARFLLSIVLLVGGVLFCWRNLRAGRATVAARCASPRS